MTDEIVKTMFPTEVKLYDANFSFVNTLVSMIGASSKLQLRLLYQVRMTYA